MTEQVQVPQRPDNVPEKFWDAATGTVNQAALLESYNHLESKLGAGAAKGPEVAKESEAPLGIPRPEETAKAEVTANNALSAEAMQAYSKEYAENGKLSEETYAKLKEAGVAREIVDTVIEDRVSQGNNLVAKHERLIFETVGGKDNFDAIVKWAGESLGEQEVAALEASINNMQNPAAATEAIRGLQARFLMEATRHPQKMLRGQTGVPMGDGVVPFASAHEMSLAMRDKRYQPGTAYYKQVHARVAAMK